MSQPLTGGCACGNVRYEMPLPLFVHCCHCTWCQRETGSAFALNAIVEGHLLRMTSQEPKLVRIPSHSGAGQEIARCSECLVALYSNYTGAGPHIAYVRVGTLDNPNKAPPNIHIYTNTKQEWVTLPPGAVVREEWYNRYEFWPKESLDRLQTLMPVIMEYNQSQNPEAV